MTEDQINECRDRFEIWYAEHFSTSIRTVDAGYIKSLREGDHYGAQRGYLNGCWVGWCTRGTML